MLGLKCVHFYPEAYKLSNELFAPTCLVYNMLEQEQDKEEEETHSNLWVTEILRFHWAATVRSLALGVGLPVQVNIDLGQPCSVG